MRKTAAFLWLLLWPAQSFSAPATSVGDGLFVSMLKEPYVLSSRENIDRLIERASSDGYRVLFVQVYRANRSWFRSSYADSSLYDKSLKTIGEDPLKLLIRRAHKKGIQVHAWMNLLSLSANEKAPMLEKYGPSILTKNRGKKPTLADYKIDNQYFLEPGDPRVSGTLTQIVKDLVSAYPELDGIQFDYIRYPDWNPSYGHSKMNLERFHEWGGVWQPAESDPEWRRWKRDQVTYLVRRLKKAARAIKPNIQVSTTGLVPYIRAREEAFQDWKEWVKSGLVDFVTLMCYAKDELQFTKYLEDARIKLPGLKNVNIAIGAYALTDKPKVLGQQWDLCQTSTARSCVVLDYASLPPQT